MNPTASKLVELRKTKSLNQGQLASLAGVSQSTISRIENGDQEPNLLFLARVAKALDVELRDLAPEELVNGLLHSHQSLEFFAQCQNPFCESNTVEMSDGVPKVYWKSGKKYQMDDFEVTNFCTKCGDPLLKQCPSCDRILSQPGSRHCQSCGTKIQTRPTAEDWELINAEVKKSTAKKDEDDLPF